MDIDGDSPGCIQRSDSRQAIGNPEYTVLLMFGDLYDTLSTLWTWSWPIVDGEATAVDVERQRHSRGADTLRLSVTYKFFVGSDGPYTGESFWAPTFFRNRRVAAAATTYTFAKRCPFATVQMTPA